MAAAAVLSLSTTSLASWTPAWPLPIPAPAGPTPAAASATRSRVPLQSGTLYTYKSSTDRLEQLHVASVTVQMEQRPFAAGGVCEAFKMRVIQADGTKGPIQVAKRYKFKAGTQGFREDHVNWFWANVAAKAFEAELKAKAPAMNPVTFQPCCSLLKLNGAWYSVEDFLQGTFTKYNNIFGGMETATNTTYTELAAAFSHFSFQHSGHEHLVLDVQGVEGRYTDPAIVSRTASKYGYTDTGLQGMQGFFANHACNHLCHKLGLAPVSAWALPAPVGRRRGSSSPPAPKSGSVSQSLAVAAVLQPVDPNALWVSPPIFPASSLTLTKAYSVPQGLSEWNLWSTPAF
eukprot:EG_transcript_10639